MGCSGGLRTAASPFLPSWWLKQTAGDRPQFVLVVQDDMLLGGLSVELGRVAGVQCLRMMGSRWLCLDHLDPLIEAGHEAAVTTVIARWLTRPGARLIDLAWVRADSFLSGALAGRARTEMMAIAPWLRVRTEHAAYLAARSAGFRKTLRQASARLAAGGVSHSVRRGSSVGPSLREFGRLHAAQWGHDSRFLPGFDQFLAACRRGSERDEVAVHELAADDQLVATVVSFEVAGRVSLYQSARTADYRWRDATLVLIAKIIAAAHQRGFTEVDFLRGSESYKANFAFEARELVRLQTGCGGLIRGL